MRVKYSYLDQQFSDVEATIADLRKLVASGEFTLGPFVEAFEKKFAAYVGVKHAIGTNTGTGALILSLKAVGVQPPIRGPVATRSPSRLSISLAMTR